MLPPSTYPVNNSLAETSSFSQHQQQIPVEEFPERPDQPECTYYLKTGDCKFKYKCKYHHPKNRLPKQAPSSFNDKGLPLRPVSFFPSMLFFCASIRKPLRNIVRKIEYLPSFPMLQNMIFLVNLIQDKIYDL